MLHGKVGLTPGTTRACQWVQPASDTVSRPSRSVHPAGRRVTYAALQRRVAQDLHTGACEASLSNWDSLAVLSWHAVTRSPRLPADLDRAVIDAARPPDAKQLQRDGHVQRRPEAQQRKTEVGAAGACGGS